MADSKRVVEQGKRLGEEAIQQATKFGQEVEGQAKRVGEQFQQATQRGFEAANLSLNQVSLDFQALAAEVTDYSKRTLDDVFQTWEQLLRARTVEDFIEIQTRYAQKAYETHTKEMTKLTELCLNVTRNATKPIEQTAKKFT